MKLLLSLDRQDQFITVEVALDMTFADFMAYIEAESGIPPSAQSLVFQGKHIDLVSEEQRNQPLSTLPFSEGDIVQVQDLTPVDAPPPRPSGRTQGSSSNPVTIPLDYTAEDLNKLYAEFDRIRDQMLANPVVRDGVFQRYPQLETVYQDAGAFREQMLAIEKQRVKRELEKQAAMKKLQDDPYDPESQELILQAIREEAIMENFHAAMENNPEAFASVTMLFINTVVNKHPVKAFVDSGAQATIMSPSCAEACGIAHLIDKRFQGMAMGVGTAKILGRIHSVPIQIGQEFLDTSFTVMEGKGVDFLLGLDMLKKHRAIINLQTNELEITGIKVPFLPEAEIPKTGLFSPQSASNNNVGGGDQQAKTISSSNLGPSSSSTAFSGTGRTLGSIGRSGSSSGSSSSNNAQQGPSSSSSATSSATVASTSASSSFKPVSSISGPSSSSSSSSSNTRFAAAQPSPRQTQFAENDVKQLMDLGFSREEAIQSLTVSGGNVEHAAALLFNNF